jgi:hypothetical protein
MPYDETFELPQLEKNDKNGTCTYTHNHASSYTYKYRNHPPTSTDKKDAREFMENGKKEINRCIFFMKNCLEDKNLPVIQQATLKQSIKNDEALIEALDNAKPAICTIL